jgi:hypothetical protein
MTVLRLDVHNLTFARTVIVFDVHRVTLTRVVISFGVHNASSVARLDVHNFVVNIKPNGSNDTRNDVRIKTNDSSGKSNVVNIKPNDSSGKSKVVNLMFTILLLQELSLGFMFTELL